MFQGQQQTCLGLVYLFFVLRSISFWRCCSLHREFSMHSFLFLMPFSPFVAVNFPSLEIAQFSSPVEGAVPILDIPYILGIWDLE